MRAFGFHVHQSGGFFQTPLRAQDQPIAVVGPAVRHEVAFGTADFVARKVGGREDFDFRDDDCFIPGGDGVGGGIGDLVRGDEESIGGGMEDACFVEEGGSRVTNEELELGGRAEKGEEGVMVDEEGFGLRVGREGWGEFGPNRVLAVGPLIDHWGFQGRIYFHNAALCRFTRCQVRLSDHGCCRCVGLAGDEVRELALDDGRPLLRFPEDLESSEKDTLWPGDKMPLTLAPSAVLGLFHKADMSAYYDGDTLSVALNERFE